MRNIDIQMLPQIIVRPDNEYDIFKGPKIDTPFLNFHRFFDLQKINSSTGIPANLNLSTPNFFSKNLREFIANIIIRDFFENGPPKGKEAENFVRNTLDSIATNLFAINPSFIQKTKNLLLNFAKKHINSASITLQTA